MLGDQDKISALVAERIGLDESFVGAVKEYTTFRSGYEDSQLPASSLQSPVAAEIRRYLRMLAEQIQQGFGYGHVVKNKPPGYAFLEELNVCSVDQISVETAQPNVDPAVFRRLPNKTIILGVIDLSDDAPVESPEQVAARIAAALEHVSPERLVVAPDCGMKYLPRATAFAKLEAMVAGTALAREKL